MNIKPLFKLTIIKTVNRNETPMNSKTPNSWYEKYSTLGKRHENSTKLYKNGNTKKIDKRYNVAQNINQAKVIAFNKFFKKSGRIKMILNLDTSK